MDRTAPATADMDGAGRLGVCAGQGLADRKGFGGDVLALEALHRGIYTCSPRCRPTGLCRAGQSIAVTPCLKLTSPIRGSLLSPVFIPLILSKTALITVIVSH